MVLAADPHAKCCWYYGCRKPRHLDLQITKSLLTGVLIWHCKKKHECNFCICKEAGILELVIYRTSENSYPEILSVQDFRADVCLRVAHLSTCSTIPTSPSSLSLYLHYKDTVCVSLSLSGWQAERWWEALLRWFTCTLMHAPVQVCVGVCVYVLTFSLSSLLRILHLTS